MVTSCCLALRTANMTPFGRIKAFACLKCETLALLFILFALGYYALSFSLCHVCTSCLHNMYPRYVALYMHIHLLV
jgi:hypothetical protein